MTLQQLKYFITVCECGKINEASKQLFISQPSLSQAIHDIENEYNIKLFLRNASGVSLTEDGEEFLSYARGIVEQYNLLNEKYLGAPTKKLCSISAQHYSFVVSAFSKCVSSLSSAEYEFILRETKTYEIIEDVKTFRSEIGVLFLSDFNRKVITNLIKENDLIMKQILVCDPHVFISANNPLAKKQTVLLEDLENYPCLSFEQGIHNSIFYSEEILSGLKRKKSIKVSDRATLFNLLVGLNGYTISTGIISKEFNPDIVSKPLAVKEKIEIYYVLNKKTRLSEFAKTYLEELCRQLGV